MGNSRVAAAALAHHYGPAFSDSELPQRLLAENQQRMEEAARAED